MLALSGCAAPSRYAELIAHSHAAHERAVLSGDVAASDTHARRQRPRVAVAVAREPAHGDSAIAVDGIASDRAMNDLERENAMWERMDRDIARSLKSICGGC
jgi:hypothetical protein